MDSPRLPRALFGYAQPAVDTALAALRADAERLRARAEQSESDLAALRAESDRLRREGDAKAAALADLEAQRSAISRRLVAAEEEAERIRSQAMADAEALRAQWRAEVASAEAELLTVRQTIDGLRRDVLQLLAQTAEALGGGGANVQPLATNREEDRQATEGA